MKATGMIRRIDDLGRIVIPMEIRRNLCIEPGDVIEIFVDGGNIVLTKYQRGCSFCGSIVDNYVTVNNVDLCLECVDKIIKKRGEINV